VREYTSKAHPHLLELLMLKKDEEKVVDFLKRSKEPPRRPRGDKKSPLAAELNDQLKGWNWLDKVRAAGL
jgi:hypothetical protein